MASSNDCKNNNNENLPPSIIYGTEEPINYKVNEAVLIHRIIEGVIKPIDHTEDENENNTEIIDRRLQGEPCLVCEDKIVRYSKMNEIANQLAHGIQENYLPHENSDNDVAIAVEMKLSIELVITLLAILKAGAAYLPLEHDFPDDRVEHILEESEPSLIITDKIENASRYGGCNVTTFEHLWNISKNHSTDNLLPETAWMNKGKNEDRVCAILYTSGSTGVPKGVRLTHGIAILRGKWQWQLLPYSPTEEFSLFKTTLTYVDSFQELWFALLKGKSLLIVDRNDVIDIGNFVDTLDKYKVERIILAPSLLHALLHYICLPYQRKEPFLVNTSIERNCLTRLKTVVSSGESLPVSLARKFFTIFHEDDTRLFNFYGSTEHMGDALYYEIQRGFALEKAKKIPIGRPLPNLNVYLLDNSLNPVQKGSIGEIYISGAYICRGYVKGREQASFLENPHSDHPEHKILYKTGDYGRWEDDLVYYEGRIDSQIKVRGHKVNISEVYAALSKLSLIDKNAVICYRAGKIDQALVAFVTIKNENVTVGEIEEVLASKLQPFMMPDIMVVDSIPLLINGKVDRQTLLRQYKAHRNEDSLICANFDYDGISEELRHKAKTLFEAVAATLKTSLKKKIDAFSNYYDLGGNSLNSVLAVITLKDLGFSISIGEFLRAKNMLSIIEKMKEEGLAEEKSIETVDKAEVEKYTFETIQHHHKEAVLRIVDSFLEKGDLERYVPGLDRNSHPEVINIVWETVIRHQLSIIVKSQTGEYVACSLNMDFHDEPNIVLTSELKILLDFVISLESPYRTSLLPKGSGQVFHSFIMGTAGGVSAQENVQLMVLMETENLKVARKKGFAGILATNTSPLTQQLCNDVFKYKILNNVQINQYQATDGNRPFENAPDSVKVTVSWKAID